MKKFAILYTTKESTILNVGNKLDNRGYPFGVAKNCVQLQEILEKYNDSHITILAEPSYLTNYLDDIKQIFVLNKDAKILMLSPNPSFLEGFEGLKIGIKGYANTLINSKNLFEAISKIQDGNTWFYPQFINELAQKLIIKNQSEQIQKDLTLPLTAREKEVARYVCNGDSNKEIAQKLEISERTVKAHLQACYQKLEIKDRVSLALLLRESFKKDETESAG